MWLCAGIVTVLLIIFYMIALRVLGAVKHKDKIEL